MKGQWMIWLLVTGLAYVSGNICKTNDTEKCLTKLVRYEGPAFPLYGQGAEGLEDTCKNINESFTCLQTYIENCNGTQECDKECHKFIKELQSFIRYTNLNNFAEELCEEGSSMSQSYLKSYECLEKNTDTYSACHNISEISKEYLYSIKDETAIPKRCCYFSWYHDCFNNITEEHCDNEATQFVKYGLFKLAGSITEKICGNSDVKCSTPPVPPVQSDEIDHKNINDSKKDKHETSSASIISCPVAGTVVAFYFILFMNLLLY